MSPPRAIGVQPRPTARSLVPALLRWFADHARDLPWRRTRDPYAIWVSEIMLQQTQVKTVIPYWERWLRELPNIEALARAKPEKIHKLWEGLGYYTRVRNMQKAAQQIVATARSRRSEEAELSGDSNSSASSPRRLPPSEFPLNFDDILALPGIGRYTAGAIASIAFNQPAPILDGNVIRVLTRLHGIGEDPREKKTNARLWQLAEELVREAHERWGEAPDEPLEKGIKSEITIKIKNPPACSQLNQSLMELGALICTPRSPKCAACPVAKHCTARHENRAEEFPRPQQRATVTARRFVVFVMERHGRFLVQQRGADCVNAHLWEFPNWEAAHDEPAEAVARQQFGAKPATLTRLCVVKHSITRYRMTAEAYRVSVGAMHPKLPGVWRTRAQLNRLPFTSAHRQITTRLGP